MKRASAVALLTLIVAACGEPGPGATTTLSPEPTTTLASIPTTTDAVEAGVEVMVTASAVRQPDGSIELCPPGMTAACPGIILVGEIDPALLATDEETRYVRVSGRYDGHSLQPSSAPVAFEYGPASTGDFASLCPDLRGTPSVNPDDALTQAVTDYAMSQPDYAALWWDRERAVLTVWFKGEDVSAHQTAIADLAGEEPVCVVGGATYSEAELMEAAQLLDDFADSRGLPLATFGYGVGGLSNRIDLPLEEIDAETRSALADLVGDRVVPFPYIEMVNAPLSDLPDPILAVEGDVDILTSRVRTGGGMDALGRFEVLYDPDLNCVYFSGSEEGDAGRTVPVWPFGYSATSSPFIVYDYDGAAVAGEGDTVELGGGFVGTDHIDGDTCGADGAWIVNR
jgi:hypothetical protein